VSLTEQQIERYSRNILLPDVGGIGQGKLLEARVLIIGAGGLGSPAALYLAAAGVGTIGIADSDTVDISNLQRQVIHATPDIGRPKVESAVEAIRELNPDIRVYPVMLRINAKNIAALIADYDFIIDGTDNFTTKYLINDACVLGGKPFSHGGIVRYHGQSITYLPGHACVRCLFKIPPPPGTVPSCGEAGVLGVVAGILGTLQAAEAIKYIIGTGRLLADRFFYFDIADMSFETLRVEPDPRCPVCGEKPSITEIRPEYDDVCTERCR
jgi:molybdopterin/thiamine biosynthesis adenylyltransferase